MAERFHQTNIFCQTSFNRRKWRLLRNPLKSGKLYDVRQRFVSVNGSLVWKMSSNRTRWHSEYRRMVRTSGKPKCSLWLLDHSSVSVDDASSVCYITAGRQPWLISATPGTDNTMDVCTIPHLLFPMVVWPYLWHDEFAGEPSKYVCRVACWEICCAQNKRRFFRNWYRSMSWAGAGKASNGAVGLSENPAALRGRTVASPEVAR